MLETSLERTTVAALIDKHGAPDARSVLAQEGWLDTAPNSDGSWPMAEWAAMLADCAAGSDSELALGAHTAAHAALVLAGRDVDAATKLGVVVGARRVDDAICGRLWGPPDAEIAVMRIGAELVIVEQPDLQLRPEPVLPLRQVSVSTASTPQRAAKPLTADAAAIGRHDTVVAWMLAVEAFGALSAAVAKTVDYAKSRHLFGSTLGNMQVVQHRLVDMQMVALRGRAILGRCVRQWNSGDTPVAAHAAQTLAGGRGVWAVEQAIQLHGGIGFTWELGLHRALALAQRARLLVPVPVSVHHPLISAAVRRDHAALIDWSTEFRSSAW